ncbi:MAG: lactate permease LctP family transporter [Stigonema ocellatum SAG 48.90 = DSM 106950]|nr:lactate permease LctP family transporter [Stigonema ocellatum SAG 48.90 = DSM 106950]
MEWIQVYNPAGNAIVSTILAALPILVLLSLLGIFEIAAQWAALAGLVAAFMVAVLFYRMPLSDATAAVVFGAAYGLLPIGWIVLAAVLLYDITVHTGQFAIVKNSIASLTSDRRIQALLIAFSFGAFIEGAAGFGTPVAICAALLMGLGFPPLYAASLCLIANTAPVAFGAIGIPILTLGAITQQDPFILGEMAGRQLPFVSLVIPIWLVVTMSGWRGFLGVWPVVLVSGGSFAVVQFFWSNFIGPELVDIAGGLISLVATAAFATRWKPKDNWDFPRNLSQSQPDNLPSSEALSLEQHQTTTRYKFSPRQLARAWMPWVFLSLFVFLWGLPQSKAFLSSGIQGFQTYQTTGKPGVNNTILAPSIKVPSLHNVVYRDYPVVSSKVDVAQMKNPDYKAKHAESAVYTFNWLSATGTGILCAALLSAVYLRVRLNVLLRIIAGTLKRMRWSLFTIACMLALGYITRYSGTDATLGLAFTKTGFFYPFFASILGWLGVALTGSDTSSNVLFGSLQKITAQQLGLNPILIITANSTGGVMGKMIDAQSIVVSTASTNQIGQEGAILRFVFWHSLSLVCIMGMITMLQAYVFPWMIPGT